MATFVLVHPAWFGGWCWRDVAPTLAAAGHEVYTPTLTGLGERAHLLNRDVTLRTHVDDVVNAVMFGDLHDIILVGSSSGGTVITAAADRICDRVACLGYLDAFVPGEGENRWPDHPGTVGTAVAIR
jgi:pimeloyl-ACP methyl ester carboxylesterase